MSKSEAHANGLMVFQSDERAKLLKSLEGTSEARKRHEDTKARLANKKALEASERFWSHIAKTFFGLTVLVFLGSLVLFYWNK